MCGIVGVAGNVDFKTKKAFKDLLRIDVIRGPHSTGIAAADINNKVEVVKKALLPDDLFAWKPCEELLKKLKLVSLIGHNRYATKGAINGVNAHPFEFPTLAGVHNGTIRSQWRLPDHTEFEVDSENIYHAIEKIGVDATIGKLDGAYTLVWWDKDEKELNMVRNKERPMFYCFSEDLQTMFYASENWMLYAALTRNDIKHTKIQELPIDTLLTFSLPMKTTYAKTDKIRVRTRKVTPFVAPKSTVHVGKKSATATSGGTSSTMGKSGTQQLAGSSKNKPVLDPDMFNTNVDCYPIEIVSDPSGEEYIECILLADTQLTIRIYLRNAAHLRRYVEKGGHIFHGKVTGGVTVRTADKVTPEYILDSKKILVTVDNRMAGVAGGK